MSDSSTFTPSALSGLSPSDTLAALLRTIEFEIIPLTRVGVSSGSKVFGAAILSTDTTPYTVATNDERVSPLLHGEINCIQKFYTTFPEASTRPDPRKDCIFLATHEPCSLCLSGIAWSGFKEVFFLFTHEDSRDRFAIPYDLEILEHVFRVGHSDSTQPLYNKKNKFFTARSLDEYADRISDEKSRRYWKEEISRVKVLYDELSETYQEGKKTVESASTWK
ncbi:unnamed protein product [Kuraishia capsulata CBS 1993]|uniref:CMP/dCMP-type deaminase domain-containing protein n=1 Tax=Kuraishia capsulata CBS 1993 TaxID=1382522 RepID=W6ML14_9ASCO|nr:uncharacterized protein KUCA_T00003126001 [Kuraishia capsulata CBS 1993]CDK27149.1 unnamed protein product [Kuraishia capsulata CBS 1993]